MHSLDSSCSPALHAGVVCQKDFEADEWSVQIPQQATLRLFTLLIAAVLLDPLFVYTLRCMCGDVLCMPRSLLVMALPNPFPPPLNMMLSKQVRLYLAWAWGMA